MMLPSSFRGWVATILAAHMNDERYSIDQQTKTKTCHRGEVCLKDPQVGDNDRVSLPCRGALPAQRRDHEHQINARRKAVEVVRIPNMIEFKINSKGGNRMKTK